MTEQTVPATTGIDNIGIVEKFLYALRDEDFDTVGALLDDDVVYQNVGFSTLRGGQRVTTLLSKMEGRVGFDVKIHRSAADGATVLNERSDVIVFGPVRVNIWACGVFEVHDGRITLWRDRFDMVDFVLSFLRGAALRVLDRVRTTR